MTEFSLSHILPSDRDTQLADQVSKKLAPYLKGNDDIQIKLVDQGREGDILDIPISAVRILFDILVNMARGNAMTLLPLEKELTTQQAADILNVSRPHLVGLLENGEIKFRKVGKHRRVRFEDLIQYKETQVKKAESFLDDLANESQQMGLYE